MRSLIRFSVIDGAQSRAPNGQTTTKYDQHGTPIWGFRDLDGKPCCCSPLGTRPGFCQSELRMRPSGRCRIHGGKSLQGAGHRNAKHLRHAKGFKALQALPERYQADFGEIVGHPELTNVRPHLAKLIVRIKELERSLDNKDAADTLRQIAETWEVFNKAVMGGDDKAIEQARRAHDRVVRLGGDESLTWDKIIDLTEKARRFIETDTKIQAQTQNMIPLATLRDYTMRLIDIIRTAVYENCNMRIDAASELMRRKLLEAKFDPDRVDEIMGVIAPIVSSEFMATERNILSDISRGVASLYSINKALPG